MRVGGRHYLDDNQGAGYRLYHQDEILMGKHLFVHPQSYLHYSKMNGWSLYGIIYAHVDVVGDLYVRSGEQGDEYNIHAVSHGDGEVRAWHFEIPVNDVAQRYFVYLKYGDVIIFEDGPFTATFF